MNQLYFMMTTPLIFEDNTKDGRGKNNSHDETCWLSFKKLVLNNNNNNKTFSNNNCSRSISIIFLK